MRSRRSVLAVLLFVFIVASTLSAWAIWFDNGVRITDGERAEYESRIAPDGAGGAYIAWIQGFVSAFLKDSIFIQRIDGNGNILWSTANISLTPDTTIAWSPIDVSPDGSGGVLVCWADGRDGLTNEADVYAQRLDSSGNKLWGAFGAEVYTGPEGQNYPLIVSDGAGGAVIVFRDDRNDDDDLRAQRLDASGSMLWSSSGIPVCTDPSDQNRHQIVSDGAGGVIVTWDDNRTGSSDIYAQRIDINGAVQWTLDGIPICLESNQQTFPRIVSDDAGGAIITWESQTPELYAQRIDASGDTLWAADGVVVRDYYAGSAADPQIASDGSGGAVLCWYDSRTPRGIYGQRIDADGDTLWGVAGVPVALGVASIQNPPRIASDGSGGAAIVWQEALRQQYDYGDIYAQTVDASGVTQGPSDGVVICSASGMQRYVDIATDDIGGGIITWSDSRDPAFLSDIYAGRLSFQGSTTTDAETPDLPRAGFLSQNYPNPFNPNTTIAFGLSRASRVKLSVYDTAGRLVRVVLDEERDSGHYLEHWDGINSRGQKATSGVYFFRLTAESFSETRKMLLLR